MEEHMEEGLVPEGQELLSLTSKEEVLGPVLGIPNRGLFDPEARWYTTEGRDLATLKRCFWSFGGAMRVLTLVRRPFEGSVTANCLEHASGALNIDSTRIETTDKMSFSRAAPLHESGGEQGRTWNPTSTPGIEREQHSGGRWPANVLVSETASCDGAVTRFFKKVGVV